LFAGASAEWACQLVIFSVKETETLSFAKVRGICFKQKQGEKRDFLLSEQKVLPNRKK
jgi:hypothetical protein